MSAAKHTPTLNAGGFENGGFAYLEIGTGRKSKRIAAADAITAINSHDALVEALEKAREELAQHTFNDAGARNEEVITTLVDIGVALKAAKVEA